MSMWADIGNVFQHVTVGPTEPPPPPEPKKDGVAEIAREFQRPREQTYAEEFEKYWAQQEAKRLAEKADKPSAVKLKTPAEVSAERDKKEKKEKTDQEDDEPGTNSQKHSLVVTFESLVNMLGRSLLRMNQRRFRSCKMSSLSIPFQEINGREVRLHALVCQSLTLRCLSLAFMPAFRLPMFVNLCASVCVSACRPMAR